MRLGQSESRIGVVFALSSTLGLAISIAIYTFILVHRPEEAKNYVMEAFKTTLQMTFVVLLGAIVTYAMKQHEIMAQKKKDRLALLNAYFTDVVSTYHLAKKTKRLLRAGAVRTDDSATQIPLAHYSSHFETLQDAQLKLEELCRKAQLDADLLGGERAISVHFSQRANKIIIEHGNLERPEIGVLLRSAEHYLRRVAEEFEKKKEPSDPMTFLRESTTYQYLWGDDIGSADDREFYTPLRNAERRLKELIQRESGTGV